jgi:hypothetical protein
VRNRGTQGRNFGSALFLFALRQWLPSRVTYRTLQRRLRAAGASGEATGKPRLLWRNGME